MSKAKTQNGPQLIELAKKLDLTAAAPLAKQIGEVKDGPIELNASQVERLGGQCLQVLLCAKRHFTAKEQGFQITNASDAFSQSLETLGISPDQFTQMEIVNAA